MKELIIKKSNAATAYRNADAKGKKLPEDLIGKDNLQPEKITDRIKTFEDVLNEMSGSATQDVCDLLNYKTEDPDMISAKAYIKIVLIARALNEGSSSLMEMISQVPKSKFPFTTTIVKESERLLFT